MTISGEAKFQGAATPFRSQVSKTIMAMATLIAPIQPFTVEGDSPEQLLRQMRELLGAEWLIVWRTEPQSGQLRRAFTLGRAGTPPGDGPSQPTWPLVSGGQLVGLIEVHPPEATASPRQLLPDLSSLTRHLAARIGADRPAMGERERLLVTLEHTRYASGRWNIARAARVLGIPRKSLEYRIRHVHGLVDPTLL